MITDQFKGCGVATITPFKQGKIDFAALERILDYQIEGDVDYLVCLGTTAETATLTEDEQHEIIKKTLDVNQGRKPVVLGNFGGNNTHALQEKFYRYSFDGIDAILSVSPYYNKPTQEGIYQHYLALAEKSPLPIIMYNVPGRTASNINADTVVRLARSHEKIIGIKDASADLIQATKIARNVPPDFLVLSGDDPTTLPFISCGGMGVISVIANAFPKDFTSMSRAAIQGDFKKAREIHQSLIDIHHWLYLEGNPVGIKGCMHLLGLCEYDVRLPLVPISPNTLQRMKEEMDRIPS
ncbi:MAG: 4-hydroxy-tetrahydrodipicolinate synthase [Saprospiraceae bacterium]|nr:4-hydroxy-tetrahydrodipicolinate synthase [Saprospiraceae bacterium]